MTTDPGCDTRARRSRPEDEEADVLTLAGQRPGPDGEWLLVTAADGPAGSEFLAFVLEPGSRAAHGGDVLIRLSPAAPGDRPAAVAVSVQAVLSGLLVPVAAWDREDPDDWPELARAAAAFAMGMMTELAELGGDLGSGQPVDLDAAYGAAAAGFPPGITAPRRAGSR
jgi:hypothetical protein